MHRDTGDEEIRLISEELMHYLTTHKNAADTFEGLAHWWIARQRIVEEEKKVRDAIISLCKQGIIIEKNLPGGAIVYALNPANKEKQQKGDQ